MLVGAPALDVEILETETEPEPGELGAHDAVVVAAVGDSLSVGISGSTSVR